METYTIIDCIKVQYVYLPVYTVYGKVLYWVIKLKVTVDTQDSPLNVSRKLHINTFRYAL